MTTRLVSVVIPCRNYGEFLPGAIESVLEQTYPAVEPIVVDYGSTDDTAAVAAGYDGVRCISRPNRGLGPARNDGLAVAKGEFIVFLDADDKLFPDAVATSAACLEARPESAFAYGHQCYFDASGAAPQRGPVAPCCLDHEDPYAWMLRMNSPLRSPGAVLYRRAALEEIGGFANDLSHGADLDLNLRLTRSHSICCNDRMVLMTRSHQMNMTRGYGAQLVRSVSVQKHQRTYVSENTAYRDAYRAGLQRARSYWGGHLADQVVRHLAERSFSQAARDSVTLARWYPRGLVKAAAQVCHRAAARLRPAGGI